MPTSSSNHIVIIGAGIVGVSCALWLRRSGCSVTVIDRSGISELTSYGNAGILASSSVVPVQMPGLLPKNPKDAIEQRRTIIRPLARPPKIITIFISFSPQRPPRPS